MAQTASMVCFSGDLDKAYAAFIIANGAQAAGIDTTMFFTFWGLNLIKKGGLAKAKLSKMNMGGLGKAMIKKKMAEHNVSSLEELVQDFHELGGKLIACEMSMQVLGIKKEDLIPEVDDIVGVGTYIKNAKEGSINLFI